MTQNNKIYAPNVYLFAYHLCNPAESESLLWQKCHEILETKLAVSSAFKDSYFPKAKEPQGWRVNLINPEVAGKRNSLAFAKEISHDNQQISLKGFSQPLRIDDSYALGWQIRIPEKVNSVKTPAVDVSIFKEFNPDNCLLPDFVQSYFGQTLLITAWLSVEQNQAAREDSQFLKDLAQECLEKFIVGENQPSFYRQGELFGSPILEYGNPSRPDTGCHIIVWFFNTSATDNIWDETRYSDFVELFLYRNKIIRAYEDSRKIYLVTRQEYEQIERDIDKTFQYLQWEKSQRHSKGVGLKEDELEYLESQTIKMPPRAVNYTRLLIDLEFRQNTIAINAKNYQDKLNQISLDIKSRKNYNGRDADFSFLELFSKETCPQFQAQIQADLRYFKHGIGLLDKAMEAIRGIVAIEESYRDAELEATIQTVGSALGVVGIVASVAPYLIKQNPPDRKFYFPFTGIEIPSIILVLLISIGAGFGMWLLVWAIGKLKIILPKIKQRLPFR